MSEDQINNDTPAAPSRSLVLPIALVILGIAAFAYAFTTMGGMDLVDRFFGTGDEQVATPVPPKPTEDEDEDTTAVGDPADAGSDDSAVVDDGTDDSGTQAPGATTATPPTAVGGNQGTSPVTAATGVNVPADAREKMYWEQVDSQEQIAKLISGKITSFAFAPQAATSTEARLAVSTSGDAPVSGTAVLRSYDSAWFFSSITRDGHTSRGASGRRADTAVVDAIVKQQASSQAVIASFVDGGYRTVRVNNVSMGAGTATLDVEFTGGAKTRSAGQIVCISKDINGVKHWFLTSFREL